MSDSSDETPACSGPCLHKKPTASEIGAGAAVLGLALGAMVGCAPVAQPLYGVPADDDDTAIDDDDTVDDDDSAADDDDATDQPLYGIPADDDDSALGDDDDDDDDDDDSVGDDDDSEGDDDDSGAVQPLYGVGL